MPTLPICVLPLVCKLPNGTERALDTRPGRAPPAGRAESLERGNMLVKKYSARPGQARRPLANGDI